MITYSRYKIRSPRSPKTANDLNQNLANNKHTVKNFSHFFFPSRSSKKKILNVNVSIPSGGSRQKKPPICGNSVLRFTQAGFQNPFLMFLGNFNHPPRLLDVSGCFPQARAQFRRFSRNYCWLISDFVRFLGVIWTTFLGIRCRIEVAGRLGRFCA